MHHMMKKLYSCSLTFPDTQHTPRTSQVDKLVAGFTDAGLGPLAQSGLYLGGTKYLVIPGDPGSVIRGKKGQVMSETTPCARTPQAWLYMSLLCANAYLHATYWQSQR